jgi:hypothetical protein
MPKRRAKRTTAAVASRYARRVMLSQPIAGALTVIIPVAPERELAA